MPATVTPLVLLSPESGGAPLVQLLQEDGRRVGQFMAFSPSFTGGVRLATGDVTNDGVPDIFAAPASGGSAQINVFDGRTYSFLRSIRAYGESFALGMNLAVGDVLSANSGPELVVAPATGGSPVVNILDARTGRLLRQVQAYGNSYRRGVRLALGNANNDGVDDIAVAPAAGRAVVRVLDVEHGRTLNSYQVYGSSFMGGVTIARGMTKEGRDSLFVAPGPNSAPVVKVLGFSTGELLAGYQVYGAGFRGGLHVHSLHSGDAGTSEILVSPAGRPAAVVKVVDPGTGAVKASFTAVGDAKSSGQVVTGQSLVRQQHWNRWGRILAPGFAGTLSQDTLTSPNVVRLRDGRLRMYFGTSHAVGGSRYIYAAEADPSNPREWQLVGNGPMLGPSATGNLRDVGVGYPFVIQRPDGTWLMYYVTWGSWAPPGEQSINTGVAISRDEGLSWEVIREPLLPFGPAGAYDSEHIGSMFVRRTAEQRYEMWYTAAERYVEFGSLKRSINHLAHAVSEDGINWTKSDAANPVLSPRLDGVAPYEAVLSKPSVLYLNGRYHMWFSAFSMDGAGYRIDYANSPDGLRWTRYTNEIVLPLAPGNFDSRNQCYPHVIEVDGELWMFYAGNDFGATGIGLAKLRISDFLGLYPTQ